MGKMIWTGPRVLAAVCTAGGAMAMFAAPLVLAGSGESVAKEAPVTVEAPQAAAGAGHWAFTDGDGNLVSEPPAGVTPKAAPPALTSRPEGAVKSNVGGVGARNNIFAASYAVVNPDGSVSMECVNADRDALERGDFDSAMRSKHVCSEACPSNHDVADKE